MPKGDKVIEFPEGGRNEALRRIREAASNGQKTLNLSDLALDSLPSELETLKGLQRLLLGTSRPVSVGGRLTSVKPTFTDLSPVAALTNLQSLDLSGTIRLQDVSPLSSLINLQEIHLNHCVSVTDLAPLANLSALERLSLPYCKKVQHLEPLAALRSLTTLDLTRCVAVSDYRPLSGLTRLKSLRLGKCPDSSHLNGSGDFVRQLEQELSQCSQPTDFSFLAGLRELEELDLSGCHFLSDLKPLANLTQLTHLNLSACSRIDNLEPLVGLSQLAELDLTMCSSFTSLAPLLTLKKLDRLWINLTGIHAPYYLVLDGEAAPILAWWEGTIEEHCPSLNELKLLLLGQGRVGKSHLRCRIFENGGLDYYDGRLEPTQNIDRTDYTPILPEDHPVRVGLGRSHLRIRVWDFGGQNHLHSTHRFFLGGEWCFYVLVLAADRPANGEGPESNRLNYWLRTIAWSSQTTHGKKAPVVIVVTRNDEPTAAANRESLEHALQVAERHDWFGAGVVRVVRGLGWSQALSPFTDKAIWNRHRTAVDEVVMAIADHLDQVPSYYASVPTGCARVKWFVEQAFSESKTESDGQRQPYLITDDLNALDAQIEVPPGPTTEERRRRLRDLGLGLLSALGSAHWLGNMPEIMRRNPWGIKDMVFNPEWVKRPVYDLLWRAAPHEAQAGFLTDRQVQEVLAVRSGNPRGTDLYERTAFTEEDRGRVLELMKACRLIFDSPHEPGILVPDLLETARLPDDEVVPQGWRYSAEFLPEKVLLRFIAQQYRAIDTRTGHCFRNRVTWRRGEHEVVLEAHFSPSGGTRPYVLIRPAATEGTVSEWVAATIGVLLDEIFVDEGLGEVRRELRPAGESRLNGQFVFRKLPPTRHGPKAKPSFSIIFDGVDLGSNWRFLTGLEYLHTLVCHPGQPCFVRDLAPDARAAYRFQQDAVERKQTPDDRFRKGGRFTGYKITRLKRLREAAKDSLARAVDKDADEQERRKYELQIEELTYEIERRDDPQMKKLMNRSQLHLSRAVEELKERMRKNGIHAAYLEHFDHCTSSEQHPLYFCYRPASQVEWETD